jgi:NAD(P)-dependent dehydrogenase (short-subunit alcohol dehydrogenase family)
LDKTSGAFFVIWHSHCPFLKRWAECFTCIRRSLVITQGVFMKKRLQDKVAIDEVADEIVQTGGQAISFADDISQEDLAKDCIDVALKQYGRLDIPINNAGVLFVNAATDEIPADIFDSHIQNNIRSAFLMTKYALPHLRETRGNIICERAGRIYGQKRSVQPSRRKAGPAAFF